MTNRRTYASPTAFRRAVTDRLKATTENSRRPLPALQRQVGYDRLLARLYLVDDRWIVKGGAALLARDIGVRATRDLDDALAAIRPFVDPLLDGSASGRWRPSTRSWGA